MYDTALFSYLYDILFVNLRMALLKQLKYAANIVNRKDYQSFIYRLMHKRVVLKEY
jgi:hypothetical protein